MKRVLMISYAFPPLSDVGGLRCLGFGTYLEAHGWEAHVLTVRNPDPACGFHRDEGDPSPQVRVHRSRSLVHSVGLTRVVNAGVRRLFRILGFNTAIFESRNVIAELVCVPDPFFGWIPATFLKARRLIAREKIDVIFATCRPFSAGLVGVLLKQVTGRPLVVDLRDPWRVDLVLDYLGTPPERRRALVPGLFFKVRMWIDRILEAWMMRRVDRLMVTNEETRSLYEAAYPHLRGRVVRIYNGFNDHFLRDEREESTGKFTVGYVGNYYYEYDPSDLVFRALAGLIRSGRIPADRVEFLWVGPVSRWLRGSIEALGLQPIFRATGHVRREEAARHLRRMSLLVVRIVRPCLSTKLFEGMAAGVPILATIEEGEAESLVRRYSGTHYIVRPRDERGAEEALLDAFGRWERGELPRMADGNYLNEFNKRALTGAFSKVLEDVVCSARGIRRASEAVVVQPCAEADGSQLPLGAGERFSQPHGGASC